jgi:hypothetical protein
VDAKTHRAERRLEVRHVHFEPWLASGAAPPTGEPRLDQEQALTGVAEALSSLATFVGGDDVRLRRVTPHRLRAPLARALRRYGAEAGTGVTRASVSRKNDAVPSAPIANPI